MRTYTLQSRRRFLRISALGAATTAAVLTTLGMLRLVIPGLSRDRLRVDIGAASDYPVNTFTLLRDAKLFIYRDHQGIRAVSAECTHLGCVLETSEDGFICPCHGSAFTPEGNVRFGPAPRPLNWYKVEVDINQRLMVNRRIRVQPHDKLLIT